MRLRLEGVTLAFAGRAVIKDASHEFESPGFVALVGPSGSGKSTLLALIAGHLLPDSGSTTSEPSAPRIDWVFQSSPMLGKRTALDNVKLGGLARGWSVDRSLRAAWSGLESVGVAHLASALAGDLSGGERQRVAIARGVASDADILLVDEPTSALDSDSRVTVCDALGRASRSRLVIAATHDEVVARYADVILRLDAGRLVEARRE